MDVKLYIGSEQADFNEAFNVMFSIGDIRNPGYGNNNKTYTLNLPLTKTNKRLLKYANQPDVKTEVTTKGWLYLGEQLIISGSIQVLKTDDYYASVIISADDWITDLASKKMTTLDLSAYDHTLTHANVEDSWTASFPFYRYPMINFGALVSSEFGTTAKWYPNDFIPAMRVVDIITKILSPYTIVSTWMTETYIKNLYILAREISAEASHILNKGAEIQVANASDNQNSVSVAPGASGTAVLSAITMTFNTTILNEGANFSGGGQYTIPEDGTYRLKATVLLGNTGANGLFTASAESYYLRLKLVRSGVTSTIVDVTSPTFTGTEIINSTSVVLDSWYYHFLKDDVITVELSVSCTATNNDVASQNLIVNTTATVSKFLLIWDNACLSAGLNKNISGEEMLPDISQLDFISAIKDIFNLRFFCDKSNKTIYIEPWQSLISSTVVDLTEYVDYEYLPQQEPISGNYYNKIRLKWKDDSSDIAFTNYLQSFVSSPGAKNLTLSSEYCKPGEDTREHSFSSIITDYNSVISEFSVKVPQIYKTSTQSHYAAYDRLMNFNTRIVEWKGLTSGFTWYYETETKTQYPKIQGLDWNDIYANYWIKFFHYIDKGKLFTIRLKNKPGLLSQFSSVVNTSADEGFRPTYLITLNGIKNYFVIQKATGDGNKIEIECFLKQ